MVVFIVSRTYGTTEFIHLFHPSTLLVAIENTICIQLIMVFSSPEWVPKLPFDPLDSIPISDFMLNEKYGRYPLAQSKPPFICGISGTEYTALQVRDRVDFLARSLAKEFGQIRGLDGIRSSVYSP
jgi:hypothetical protein